MTDTKQRPRVEKLTEPAKRWRNWYRANCTGQSLAASRLTRLGEVYPSRDAFPSKEIAEQRHEDTVAACMRKFGADYIPSDYLGAHPDPVTP